VFDEEIRRLVTARNISPYGYLALIGETKLSIYLCYAEEEACTYDHVWTINFWDLRSKNIGKSIEIIDFSPNCEDFVAYMNSGKICTFSMKMMQFSTCCATLHWQRECPVTEIRSFMNNKRCIAFSKPNNLIMILNLTELAAISDPARNDDAEAEHIVKIRPGAEGFTTLVNFQVDNSDKFLICCFANNKVGVFDTTDGTLLLQVEELNMRCDRCFIDEAGTFITMLDESRKQANIYSIEWQWDVDKPNPPKRKLEKVGEEENEGNMHSDGDYDDEGEGSDNFENASKSTVIKSQ